LFGDNVAFTDHTNDYLGFAPRSFASFFDAAAESAISRLYGGIHYRSDIEEGLAQGACVGRAVNALAFRAP
jgi:membrane-associated phospholipid phosphatase